MKNLFVVLAIGLSMFGPAQFAQAGSFTDTFDSIDPAWVTDRYEPAAFVSDAGRLRIDISTADSAANRPAGFGSTFYSTQGRQRAAGIDAPWQVSADIFLSAAFNTTTGALFRSDLWTRDSNLTESESQYPIIGFTNASPTDVFNPLAADRNFRLQVWDGNTGWVNLGLPAGVTFDAWNTLTVKGTGDSFVFSLNGVEVYTDNTGSEIGAENLRTVFLEAYNFGDSSYSVFWDNVSAQTVPTPAAMGVGVLGFGLLALRRGRRSSAA